MRIDYVAPVSLLYNFDSTLTYSAPLVSNLQVVFVPLLNIGKLDGEVNASSSVVGDLHQQAALNGEVNASSSVVGDLHQQAALNGEVNVDSYVTGNLLRLGSINSRTFQGIYIHQNGRDFYSTVYITTTHIDAITLAYNIPITFEIWNACSVPVTLSAITQKGANRIVLIDSSTALPATLGVFAPFESRTYQVTLGDSRYRDYTGVNAVTYMFSWGGAHPDTSLTISGVCSPVCVIPADWTKPIIESLEWHTEILTNYDATEQRVKLRKYPRTALKFHTVTSVAQQAKIQNLLYGLAGREVVVPLWAYPMPLTAEIQEGDIWANAEDIWRLRGELVILAGVTGDYQIIRLGMDTSAEGVQTAPAYRYWPIGTVAYPIYTGVFRSAPVITRKNPAYCDTLFDLISTQRLSDLTTFMGDISPTYRGIKVFEYMLNWAGDVQVKFEYKAVLVDNGIAAPTYVRAGVSPTKTTNFRCFLNSSWAIKQFRNWLDTRCGKLNPFWLPSGCSDLVLVNPIISTSETITVQCVEYTTTVNAQIGYRDIRIQLTTGVVHYRRIVSSTIVNQNSEALVLDSLLPAISLKQVKLISFMAPVRLDVDAVEITHYSPSFATSEFPIKGIIYNV